MPEVGDSAPDFTLPTDGGGEFKLSAQKGSPVVVYFYPKDDTSGCTKEAIAFTENLDAFKSAGVWVEKSMYGRKYMGVERATFLVDGDGKIAQAWRKVKVPGHAEKVLAAVKEL